MLKFVKVLLFIGYILYAFRFVDDKAREGGIIDAILSLVVASFFGYGIFHLFWLWKADESTPRTNNSETKREHDDKLEKISAQQSNSGTIHVDAKSQTHYDEAEKLFNKGENNFNLGNYYEAIDDYSKAIQLNSNRDRYYFRRAMAMKHRADELFTYRTDVVNQVLDGYTRAMSDYRFNYYRKFDDGTVPPYCEEEILSDLNRAIELNPMVIKYYSARAIHAGSMQDFAKVIELAPDDHRAYFNRGYQKDRLNDYDGALADYTKAIDLKPDEARYYNNRALLRESANDYDGAKTDFEHAYQISPELYGHYNPNNEVPWERQSGRFGFIDIE